MRGSVRESEGERERVRGKEERAGETERSRVKKKRGADRRSV